MAHKNYYDVTQWHTGNANEDIGEVINSIIADIKKDKHIPMLITAVNPVLLSIFRPEIII